MSFISLTEFRGILSNIINPAYVRFKFEVTEDQSVAWWNAVSDLPQRAVADAALDWIASSAHPPTPADLREGARQKVVSRPGDYGLEKNWKPTVETVNAGPMPSHIKAALRALVSEAERLRSQEDINRKLKERPVRDEDTGEVKLDAWGNPYHPLAIKREKEGRKILTMEERLEVHREWVKSYNEKYWKTKEDGTRKFEAAEVTHLTTKIELGGGNNGTYTKREDGSDRVVLAEGSPFLKKLAREKAEREARENGGGGFHA